MRFLLSILLFVISVVAYAQPPRKFYSTYGGNGYDVGNDVKQTLDGGYIITGSTSSYGQGNTDMYLLKIDSMGQKVFQNTFGGLNNEIGKSVVQLLDSSYVMAGYTSSSGVGGYDVFLVKADKNGNLIWQKTIGGADWDFANSMVATADGGFIIAGTTYSYGHGNADGYVIKADANGDTTWTKSFGGLRDDEFKSVIQTSDGNYALTGYTKSYNDSLGDVWAIKLNVNGDTLWRKFYGGNKEDFGNQIIEHPSGDFFIAGGTESFGVTIMNGIVIHISSFGNYIFQRLDNTSSSYQIFNSIAISKRSNNIVNAMAKETVFGFGAQFKMLEMNLGLNYINGTDYGSNIDDEMYKIISTKDKGYVCVGFTKGYSAINSDVYFLKSDSNLVGSVNIVSVNEVSNKILTIKIFPNPVSTELNIKSDIKISHGEMQLVDITGEEINLSDKSTFLSDYCLKINTEHINSGIYFLKYLNWTDKIFIIH